ncbi:MAG: DUF4286 family protein [Chitinophagales bacterium]|nr:DUF4286 family protein [Chitinophagales bacterium]
MELEVVDAFKSYIQQKHLPSLNFDEKLMDYKLLKLLNVDESEAMTITLQYFLKDMATYNQHLVTIDSQLKRELFNMYGEKVLYFCSILEKI